MHTVKSFLNARVSGAQKDENTYSKSNLEYLSVCQPCNKLKIHKSQSMNAVNNTKKMFILWSILLGGSNSKSLAVAVRCH